MAINSLEKLSHSHVLSPRDVKDRSPHYHWCHHLNQNPSLQCQSHHNYPTKFEFALKRQVSFQSTDDCTAMTDQSCATTPMSCSTPVVVHVKSYSH
jgi:hypothetical protein